MPESRPRTCDSRGGVVSSRLSRHVLDVEYMELRRFHVGTDRFVQVTPLRGGHGWISTRSIGRSKKVNEEVAGDGTRKTRNCAKPRRVKKTRDN